VLASGAHSISRSILSGRHAPVRTLIAQDAPGCGKATAWPTASGSQCTHSRATALRTASCSVQTCILRGPPQRCAHYNMRRPASSCTTDAEQHTLGRCYACEIKEATFEERTLWARRLVGPVRRKCPARPPGAPRRDKVERCTQQPRQRRDQSPPRRIHTAGQAATGYSGALTCGLSA
jgi:hypothetical protein